MTCCDRGLVSSRASQAQDRVCRGAVRGHWGRPAPPHEAKQTSWGVCLHKLRKTGKQQENDLLPVCVWFICVWGEEGRCIYEHPTGSSLGCPGLCPGASSLPTPTVVISSSPSLQLPSVHLLTSVWTCHLSSRLPPLTPPALPTWTSVRHIKSNSLNPKPNACSPTTSTPPTRFSISVHKNAVLPGA